MPVLARISAHHAPFEDHLGAAGRPPLVPGGPRLVQSTSATAGAAYPVRPSHRPPAPAGFRYLLDSFPCRGSAVRCKRSGKPLPAKSPEEPLPYRPIAPSGTQARILLLADHRRESRAWIESLDQQADICVASVVAAIPDGAEIPILRDRGTDRRKAPRHMTARPFKRYHHCRSQGALSRADASRSAAGHGHRSRGARLRDREAA